MKELVTAKIADITKDVLRSLGNFSFFRDEQTRDDMFSDVDHLERLSECNCMEEDLMEAITRPEDMQGFYELMVAQMPRLTIVDKYDRDQDYREKFGFELAKDASDLILGLDIALQNFWDRLIELGEKYGLDVGEKNSDIAAGLQATTAAHQITDEEQPQQQRTNKRCEFPPQLDTPRMRRVVEMAIDRGWMEWGQDGRHIHWNGIGGKGVLAQLAYFMDKVFNTNPRKKRQIPHEVLGKLFNVSRLDSSLSGVFTAKNVQPWRKPIDDFFGELKEL